MFLIDDLLLLPFSVLKGIAEAIDQQIQKETSDADKIQEKLMELQFKFEMDEIDEQEYTRQEAELLAQLEQARKR
ncbi:MAG: gas vesicle protein GvpG [Candidatus Thermochlorobacter aerophilum]|jgi:outer membrane translocation and assembly module TamA|uniref:Gas vesicle protein GvpG n=1 Tax=Candidatus Thermochlorobacter aerophilus TaxID=1868324 RepID=A0A395M335_9BACT|nr:MAG: gas vesicle protein GvpG [Candidatus Thermochlorobacter aerophilum]